MASKNTTSNDNTLNDNDIIPRHVPSNPYNYSAAQLAERKKTLLDLAEVYPSLPFSWLEMVYDWRGGMKNHPRLSK